MHFSLSTVIAIFIASASLTLAQDCSSVVCVLGDSVCNRVCQLEGHPEGGKCVQRDGCTQGDQICVCGAAKRDVVDGDELLKHALQGVTTVDEFIAAVFEDDATQKRDAVKEERDQLLGKRSICCSFPDPIGGLCCEAHCAEIGHLEGGQCNSEGVCVCG